MERIERYRGAILGLAAGDALGAPVEFKKPGTFDPVEDMQSGGPWNLEAGQWTDDTSLALCLAESLIETKGFDPIDQLKRYLNWYKTGYLSSTGVCFDTGYTTRYAFKKFEETGKPFPGSTDPEKAGNGSLMRLAPVPLFFANKSVWAIERSGDSSRTTHGATSCVEACKYFGGLIVGAVNGVDKSELLLDNYTPVKGYWDKVPISHLEISRVVGGSYKHNNPPLIRGTGYVVDALEAALWAFYNNDSFEEGCLAAVNLGDDADTTAAIYGQIAGAYYGEQGIPKHWRDKLTFLDKLKDYANKLYELAPR